MIHLYKHRIKELKEIKNKSNAPNARSKWRRGTVQVMEWFYALTELKNLSPRLRHVRQVVDLYTDLITIL